MELTPDPDRAAWIARLRAQIARDMPAVNAQPRFTVLRLAAPALTPGVLAEWHQENGELTEVELAFGDPLSAAGPYVAVRSQASADQPEGRADLVADERVRLADMAGLTDAAPGGQLVGEALFTLDGSPLPVTFRREGMVWAADFPTARGWASVVARGLPVTGVELATVTDLAPFRDARPELLRRLFGRPEPGSGPAAREPVAEGSTQAHETLVSATLADQELFREPPGQRRRPPPGITSARMWEAAVRAQMALARQSRNAANDAVTSMVNHVIALDGQSWFGNERLRAAATAEVIGWTAFGLPVRSAPAQRAWTVLWSSRHARHLVTDPLAEVRTGEREWSLAWRQWAHTER